MACQRPSHSCTPVEYRPSTAWDLPRAQPSALCSCPRTLPPCLRPRFLHHMHIVILPPTVTPHGDSLPPPLPPLHTCTSHSGNQVCARNRLAPYTSTSEAIVATPQEASTVFLLSTPPCLEPLAQEEATGRTVSFFSPPPPTVPARRCLLGPLVPRTAHLETTASGHSVGRWREMRSYPLHSLSCSHGHRHTRPSALSGALL